jgi:hypothetical protein
VLIGIEDRCVGELRHRCASRYSTYGSDTSLAEFDTYVKSASRWPSVSI